MEFGRAGLDPVNSPSLRSTVDSKLREPIASCQLRHTIARDTTRNIESFLSLYSPKPRLCHYTNNSEQTKKKKVPKIQTLRKVETFTPKSRSRLSFRGKKKKTILR